MESLFKQIRRLNKNNVFDNKVKIDLNSDGDLSNFVIELQVPEDTIHYGARYRFRVKLDSILFLNSEGSPDIMCVSPICHPNILKDHRVCCNLLGQEWESGTSLEAIISTIYCLLQNPEFDNGFPNWTNTIERKRNLSGSDSEEGDRYYNEQNYESDVREHITTHYDDDGYLRQTTNSSDSDTDNDR